MARDLPTVLLSLETTTREFDSKFVLAAALANRGCRAIVGHKEAVKEIARASNRIVWLGKSVFSRADEATSFVHDLVRNDSPLIFHHDEGGIYPERDWDTYLLRSHPPEFFLRYRPARICVWGEKARSLLRAREPGIGRALAVTGNPRFDLCDPRYAWLEAPSESSDRDARMPYILVNTRFATVAHSEGMSYEFRRAMLPTSWPDWMSAEEIRDLWFTTWSRDARDLSEFVVLIKELAHAFPGHTILLRPHPSENLDFYRTVFESFANVVVNREGSVVYWIRGADLVLHCKCTTGVEAVLAGRPVLHFWPDRAGDVGLGEEVAREAGAQAGTIEEALALAKALLAGEAVVQRWSASAVEVLNNLAEPAIPRFVAETLAVIDESGIRKSELNLPRPPRRFRPLGYLRHRLRPREVGYVQSKRGRLDPARAATLLEGSKDIYPGASLGEATDSYVVVEPR